MVLMFPVPESFDEVPVKDLWKGGRGEGSDVGIGMKALIGCTASVDDVNGRSLHLREI